MSLGSLRIDVGANLKGLEIGLDDAQSHISDFVNETNEELSHVGEQLKLGISDQAINQADVFSQLLHGVGSTLETVSTKAALFGANTESTVKPIANVAHGLGDMLSVAVSTYDTLGLMNKLFPVMALNGTKAMNLIAIGIKSLFGPIGLAIGLVTALGVAIYKNMDEAAEIITWVGNQFIKAYNSSRPLAMAVEGIGHVFRTGYESAKAFFNLATTGIDALAKGAYAIANGRFDLLGDIFGNAKQRGSDIAKDFNQSLLSGIKNSATNIADGLPELQVSDVRDSAFFRGMQNIGDSIASIWDKLYPADMSGLDAALGKLSNTWQKATKGLRGHSLSIKTPLDILKEEIARLDAYMRNQFLAGDIEGAKATFQTLDELKTKLAGIEASVERLENPRIAIDIAPIAPLGITPQLQTAPQRVSEIATEIRQIELQLKSNPQDAKVIDALTKRLKELHEEADKLAVKAPAAAAKTSSSFMKLSDTMRDSLRGLKDSVADAIATGITNLFDGPDRERLAALNEEMREQQRILTDKSATKEQREAAKARLAIVDEEIAAEKARGNVIVQTGKLVIDSAKQAIQAALAKALANVIAGEASKGLIGLVTAGIAVAGISALFSSKVPKLASGGVIDKPTFVQVGEYPGAHANPEIITPENKLAEVFNEQLKPIRASILQASDETMNRQVQNEMNSYRTISSQHIQTNKAVTTQAHQQIYITGDLTHRADAEGLYTIVKFKHQQESRATGRNAFVIDG